MPDSSLSGGDMALVAIVLVISLAALGFAAYLVKAVLAADQGTAKMQEIAQGGAGGRGGLPEPAVPDPRRLRRHRLPAAAPAARSPRAAGASASAARCSSWSARRSPRRSATSA